MKTTPHRTIPRPRLRSCSSRCSLPVVLSACPLCKEAVPDKGPSMWRGMYWSILLMVAMPFAAAGTIAILVLRARRRQTSMSGGSAGARS